MKIKLYIFFLLFSSLVFAQQKRVTTLVDSTKVKIGAQINLTFKTTVDTLSKVAFPEGKLFGNLEVLESYPTDTIKENDKYQLIKKYGLTQFDSGKYTIPSLKVIINSKPFATDSVLVEILPVVVDTLKQHMYDIKDISTVPNDYSNWWIYLLILIGIGGIGYLIYYLIKKNKKPLEEEIVYASPIEKATAHLKSLEKKSLVERGEVKEYYSELTDIARTYIEEAIEIPAMESTTDELISAFKIAIVKKKLSLTEETIKNLEKVLKQADLVKFAKSKPLEFEIADDKIKIEKTIFKIHQSIPEEIEEEELEDNEANKAKILKRKKAKKRTLIIVSALVVLFVSLSILVAVKGFDFLKDNIIGHPTKELLKGEWVSSQYGNPAIKIETPKVLKRMDITKMMGGQQVSEMADMQMFGYGTMMDHFYIAIMTTKFKQEIKVELAQALEGSLKMMEANGAQNILVKQEEFNTKDGFDGLKGYGTMDILDPITKKSRKAYYEVIYFGQEGGLQQIIVLHEEGDEVANEITERIMNSVEIAKIK
jgi:DNA-binding MarR family transcriptional regulator